MAVRQLTPIDMNGLAITNLPASPSGANDAASKSYVDTKQAAATIAANGAGWVYHGSLAGTSRPSGFAAIIWVGSVEPTNAINNDVWYQTA